MCQHILGHSSCLQLPQSTTATVLMPHWAMLFCLLGDKTFQKATMVLGKCPSPSKHIFPMRQEQVKEISLNSAAEEVPVLAEVPLTS